jgi:serine O-acetyltransferase
MFSLKGYLARLRAYMQLRCCCQIPSRHLRGIKYPHPVGIVIGDGVRIAQNVRIYQNVTIGLNENVVGAKPSDYPKLEDGVWVYAGAVIFGGITIGTRSVIGANAVINQDVPPDSIAFGYNQIRPRRESAPRVHANDRPSNSGTSTTTTVLSTGH